MRTEKIKVADMSAITFDLSHTLKDIKQSSYRDKINSINSWLLKEMQTALLSVSEAQR